MVQISHHTWFIPTTYGSVITKFTNDHELIRVYLDNEATTILCSDKPDGILAQLQKNNIDITSFFDHQKKCIEEKKICMKLAEDNNWLLFSLYPLQLSVQSLNYCNARCDFCYANAPNASTRNIMDLSEIKKLKDYAATNGIKFGVSGGEPLLHPDIYEILNYREQEVYDTLITNLTTAIDLDKLKQTNVDLIQVSIHGYDNFHDQILNIKAAYKKILERMRYLLPERNMATNTVVTPHNFDSIKKMIGDLDSLQKETNKKLTYVRFVPVVPSGTGIHTYNVEEEFFNKVEHFLRDMMKKYQDLNFEIPLIHANPYEYKKIKDKWMCPAGSTVAVVRLDGHLVPCNQFIDTGIFSEQRSDQSSFHDLWLHDPMFSLRRKGCMATSNNHCYECIYLMMKEQNKLADEC